MSWTKIKPRRRPCETPIFWWFKETGSEWTCPTCGKVWVIKNNPSQFIGGRVLWPKCAPPSALRTPYESMLCDDTDSREKPRRDHWDSDEGRSVLRHMGAAFPALADEVQRGRDRDAFDDDEMDEDETPASSSLHAHEVTADDAAMIRMMAGANFGDGATVTLPSGKTINGAEMRKWIEAQD